jgi:putative ABC transport system permease protein
MLYEGKIADFRLAARALKRAPRFCVTALMVLALGIGANVAMIAVIDGVLLKPLPYGDPEQLISIWQTAPTVNLPKFGLSPY